MFIRVSCESERVCVCTLEIRLVTVLRILRDAPYSYAGALETLGVNTRYLVRRLSYRLS